MSWEIKASGTLVLVHKLMFLDTEHIIRMLLAPTEGIMIHLFNMVCFFKSDLHPLFVQHSVWSTCYVAGAEVGMYSAT